MSKPNNLIVCNIDSLRYDIAALVKSMGCFNEFRLSKACSVSGWTAPVMSTMFTGLWPWEHGVVATVKNPIGYVGNLLNKGLNCEADYFNDFKTKIFITSSWWFKKESGFAKSFDVENHMADPVSALKIVEGLKSRFQFLEEPFVIFLHFVDSHYPWFREDEYADKKMNSTTFALKDLRYYLQGTANVSTAMSALISELESYSLKFDTILFGDHGDEIWEDGKDRHPRHGHTLSSTTTLTPIFSRGEVYHPEYTSLKDLLPLAIQGRRPKSPLLAFHVIGGDEPADIWGQRLLMTMADKRTYLLNLDTKEFSTSTFQTWSGSEIKIDQAMIPVKQRNILLSHAEMLSDFKTEINPVLDAYSQDEYDILERRLKRLGYFVKREGK